MADISSDTIGRWWLKTPKSDWESLRTSLDEILAEKIINVDTYTNLKWAVGKLETLGIDFPVSAADLSARLDPYL